MSECVGHGETENLCEREGCAGLMGAGYRESFRSCSDNQFSWWGGTLCERNHLSLSRSGFPGPWCLRSNETAPAAVRLPGIVPPDSTSAALCDLISWPANRPVMLSEQSE